MCLIYSNYVKTIYLNKQTNKNPFLMYILNVYSVKKVKKKKEKINRVTC